VAGKSGYELASKNVRRGGAVCGVEAHQENGGYWLRTFLAGWSGAAHFSDDLPALTFHSLMVLSPLPDAKVLQSGLKAKEKMQCVFR